VNGYLGSEAVQDEQPNAGHDNSPQNLKPRTDMLNNHYVREVHINGVHHIALVTCHCQGADLMYTQLLPTTFTLYKTLFIIAVLDDYRLSNLECKTSAFHYFQKLHRMTCPTAPATMPHLYQELMRLSCIWRWMKKLKWAGYGQHTGKSINSTPASQPAPAPGHLANFCPTCPQPGINLSPEWKNDPNRYVLFYLIFYKFYSL